MGDGREGVSRLWEESGAMAVKWGEGLGHPGPPGEGRWAGCDGHRTGGVMRMHHHST